MLSVVMVANSLALAADTDLRHIAQGESPDSAPVSYPEGTPPPDSADVDDGTDPTDPPMVVLPGQTTAPDPADDPTPSPTMIMLPDDPTPAPDPTTGPDPTNPADPTAKPTPRPSRPPTPPPTPSDWALSPDVQPALTDARNDKEKLWFNRCLGIEQTTMPRNCVFGDAGGNFTVALIGDSHGSAMFPAFEWAARSRRLALAALRQGRLSVPRHPGHEHAAEADLHRVLAVERERHRQAERGAARPDGHPHEPLDLPGRQQPGLQLVLGLAGADDQAATGQGRDPGRYAALGRRRAIVPVRQLVGHPSVLDQARPGDVRSRQA